MRHYFCAEGGGGGGERKLLLCKYPGCSCSSSAKHRLIAMQGIASKNDGGTIMEVESVSVLLRKYSNVSG